MTVLDDGCVRTRGSALLLVLGGVGAILTMVLHPTEGLTRAAADPEASARHAMAGAVIHAVGIASFALQLAGAAGVYRRVLRPGACADLGLVALVFGTLFACGAATVNGLSAPVLWQIVQDTSGTVRESYQASWRLMHEIAGAATMVFFVGGALAMATWGCAMLRVDSRVGGAGVLIGGVGLIATAMGTFAPEVGPLLLFVVAYELWWFVVAWLLWRGSRRG